MQTIEKPKRKRIKRAEPIYITRFLEENLVDKELSYTFVQEIKANETRV
jgi:hypothetical protein